MKRETIKRETLTPAEKAQKEWYVVTFTGKHFVLVLLMIGVFVVLTVGVDYMINPGSDKTYLVSEDASQQEASLAMEKSQREARQRTKEYMEKYYPTYDQAVAQLQRLAQNGCEVPFDKCLHPLSVRSNLLYAMKDEDIAFGSGGVTLDDIEKLMVRAEIRIASQKFAYLVSIGGVKRPSDIKLLEDVCAQVYIYKRKLIYMNGDPTDSELKKLVPSGVTHVRGCNF